jgi:hypothetical protein
MAGCGCNVLKASGDPNGRSISALRGIGGVAKRKGKSMAKKKKPAKKATKKAKRSAASRKARGAHCVFTPTGKLFNCYAEKTSAARVVKGMNKRSPGWAVKSSGR